MKIKKKKGFTLIEMLIVVAIIGILATIVIFSVVGIRQKAAATKAKADMSELKKSMEMASIEGCTSLSLTVTGSGAIVNCVEPIAKSYATIQVAPSSGTYTLTIPGASNSPMSSSSGAAWSAGITSASPSAAYTFVSSGFDNTSSYTCAPSGCYCSSATGCNTIP